jgi:lipoate-protein ligase B
VSSTARGPAGKARRAIAKQSPGQRLLRVELGTVPYLETWELQRALVKARTQGIGEDLLLLCEHPEVITQGRRAQTPDRDPEAEVAGAKAAGIPVVQVERGGAATYHGPGQLVGYPIVRLETGERDLHRFMRVLEGAIIDALGAVSELEAGRKPEFTGVWSGERKLASIGIACRSWTTYHGFALNLDPDLSRFGLFSPCDLDAEVMASVASLERPAPREALGKSIHQALAEALGRDPGVADSETVKGWAVSAAP